MTPPDLGSIWMRRLMAWAVYAVPLVATLHPVGAPKYDPDIWWHLRVGQWVWEQGTVTTTDPFSRLGTHWVAYSWLYELLVFGLYSAFGLAGIVVYRAAMAVCIVAALDGLVRRLQPNTLVATGLLAAAVLALSPLFSERPWLVTILFSTLTLRVIVEVQDGRTPWWVWLLPLAYVVWANVHIQFVYGLFVLGLASLCGPRRRTLFTLTALCTLATLVNPYHARLYVVVLEYGTQPGPFRFINELKAMTFREPTDWLVLAFTGAACFAAGRRWPGTFPVVLLVASGWFAFRSCRDIWFVLLAGTLILARADWPEEEEPARPSWGMKALGAGALLGLAALLWQARGLTPERLDEVVRERFPADAAAFVRERGYEGPLYNDFNWGGYLIWALPGMPAAIDGRTNLHGDERIERFGRVWTGLSGWADDPDLSAAGVVVADPENGLVSLLMSDTRFVLVYADETAWVFAARRNVR
ncbi:MAG: hypothetical protein ACRC33_23010 [Gemmataceae bacterium]